MNTLFKLAALPAAAACLTACGTEPMRPLPDGAVDIRYICGQEEAVTVKYFAYERRAEMLREGNVISMPQGVSGPDFFFYSNGHYAIRGNTHKMRIEIGRMAPINCLAQEIY